MRQKSTIALALLLLAGTTGACKRADETKPPESAAAVPAQPAIESKGALATRHEAQDQLDSARASFLRKDLRTAASEIRSASTFLREQADSASGDVKEHVVTAASELDRLAADVDKDMVKTVKSLDYAFARTQSAEAERHHANAMKAWAKKENARVSDELTMAADHFERAAKDAGEVIGSSTKKTLADTREVAGQLTKGVGLVPEKVEKVMTTLGTEIRALGAKIEKRKA